MHTETVRYTHKLSCSPTHTHTHIQRTKCQVAVETWWFVPPDRQEIRESTRDLTSSNTWLTWHLSDNPPYTHVFTLSNVWSTLKHTHTHRFTIPPEFKCGIKYLWAEKEHVHNKHYMYILNCIKILRLQAKVMKGAITPLVTNSL